MEPIYGRKKTTSAHKRKSRAPTVHNTTETSGQIYKISDDFVMVVDTREQRSFFEPPPPGLSIIKKALKHGDYSIRGFEDKITVERKKMSDLMSYIGSEREKTCLKLEAMRNFDFKALVVEESWDDLFLPKMYSQLSSNTIRQALVSFNLRFGLHIFVHPYRSECEKWIMDRFLYFFKKQRNV